MKNRKRIVIAFVLVAVLMLGVGYAALTDNLTITGEATVGATKAQAQFEQDIFFFHAAKKDDTGGTSGTADECAVGTANNDSATFHVKSLARKDESVTFIFTIKNVGNTAYDAQITIDDDYPTNTNKDYFTCTQDIGTGIVPAGGTLDITVTVTLKKDPPQNLNMAYTLNLTATSTESAAP